MKKKKEIIELMYSDKPLLLHFYTDDCIKHKENKLTLQQLTSSQVEGDVQYVNIEINKVPKLISDLEIEGLPTILLYHEGKELWRRTGQVPERLILNVLSQIGNEN